LFKFRQRHIHQPDSEEQRARLRQAIEHLILNANPRLGGVRRGMSRVGCWLSSTERLRPQLERSHALPGSRLARNLSMRAPRFLLSVGTGEWMA
jgi:hypothetical protein